MKTIYTIWSLDVWGNATDGYEVNDRSAVNRAFEVEHKDESPTDQEILRALFDGEYLREFSIGTLRNKFNIEGDDCLIEIDCMGIPMLNLERNEGGAE